MAEVDSHVVPLEQEPVTEMDAPLDPLEGGHPVRASEYWDEPLNYASSGHMLLLYSNIIYLLYCRLSHGASGC